MKKGGLLLKGIITFLILMAIITLPENHIFETCRSEYELIELGQQSVLKLLGVKESVALPSVEPAGKEPIPTEVYKDSFTGMEFVFVKGGCFEMGDTFGDGDPDEKPVHEVCVGGFHMGKYELTVGQFREFINETGYRTEAEKGDGCTVFTGKGLLWKRETDKNWRNPGFSQGESHPVVCVSHNDAVEYMKWLNEKSKRRYRLPTEAEWEYAARSGGKREKWAGVDVGATSGSPLQEYAWYWENAGIGAHPVGQKRPNGLGLYDMSGNVWERCQDWYDKDYYSRRVRENPKGPESGQYRVFRGGGWFVNQWGVRASARSRNGPSARDNYSGFRLVLPSD